MIRSLLIYLVVLVGVNFESGAHVLLNNEDQPSGNKFPKEYIYGHLNDDFLLSGESLLFKLYVLFRDTNQPSDLSKVAYVEILDGNNEVVSSAKIPLDMGMGYGDFFIPSTFKNGTYRFVAYTKWMKNFSRDIFYTREITIVNPYSTQIIDNQEVSNDSTDIQFMAESGNALTGLPCVFGFRATDGKGKGIKLSGKIVDDLGGQVADVTTFRHGIGRVELSMEPGRVYKAILVDSLGKYHFAKLPQGNDRGVNIHFDDLEGSYELRVQAKQMNLSRLKLVLKSSDQVIEHRPLVFQGEVASESYDRATLPDGILSFTIEDGLGETLSERLVFKCPDISIEDRALKMSKSTFEKRSRVAMSLNGLYGKNALPVGYYSVSVREHNKWSSYSNKMTMDSYVLLSSKLKGEIEGAPYYLQNTKESNLGADNLMLTHGWISFEPIMKNLVILDYRGDLVTGIVRQRSYPL